MNKTTEKSEEWYRYYVIETATGWLILRVKAKDVATFLELLGDYVIGDGATPEEAQEDMLHRRRAKTIAYFHMHVDKAVSLGERLRMVRMDLVDWLKGDKLK